MNSKIALIVAIILGVFSAIAVNQYIGGVKSKAEKQYEPIKVLVAARTLKKYAPLTAQDFDTKEIPYHFYDEKNMFMERSTEKLHGLKIFANVDKGKIIFRDYMKGEDRSTNLIKGSSVSNPLKGKQRAITLKVDTLSGVAYLLKPKDKIDILWSGTVPVSVATKLGYDTKSLQAGTKLTITKVLLSKVEILALDNRYSLTPGFRRGRVVESKSGYGTITVRCNNADEAKLLIFAQNAGRLTMTKRNNSNPDVIEDDKGLGILGMFDLASQSNTLRKNLK